MEDTFPFHPDHGEQLARRKAARTKTEYPGYIYCTELVLAVNAALATRRPLLLRGNPGSGKSTVARDIAVALGRDYLEEVITSRTTAMDLQWYFDTVGRLSDAGPGAGGVKPREAYVKRGVLWQAFVRDESGKDVVVLLDEIDKADPDVPNDLLIPLEGRFEVRDLEPAKPIPRERDVLLIITSNGERELPPAFLRRCVALTLPDPSEDDTRLVEIGKLHLAVLNRSLPAALEFSADLLLEIKARIAELAGAFGSMSRRPGTAEILDAFKASLTLGIKPGTPHWATLTQVLLQKDAAPADRKRDAK